MKVNDLDLDIEQKKVIVETNLLVNNLTPISQKVGPVSLSLLLQGSKLDLHLSALNINRSTGNVAIKIFVGFEQVEETIAEYVAELIDAAFEFNFRLPTSVSITNIVLGSLNGDTISSITHFSALNIELKAGAMIQMLSTAGSIDLSGVLPGKNLLEQLQIGVKSLDLAVKPMATLEVNASLDYLNVLPISAKIPSNAKSTMKSIILFDMSIDSVIIGEIQLSYLDLVKNNGTLRLTLGNMKPFISWKTSTDDNTTKKLSFTWEI